MILNCTQDEYFADPCEVPSLSQSCALTLLSESPLHAWTTHPKLGNQRSAATRAMDDGTVLHKLLLGKGADIEIIEFDDYRTNAAKAARDAALEAGRVPYIASKFNEIRKVADILASNLLQYGIRLDGASEVPVRWNEQGERGDVCCRAMMDHVFVDKGRIYDVKKIRSAHPRMCGKHAIEYGYDIQAAAYTSALEHLRPEFEGKVDFVFLFMEIEPPYIVTPARLDGVLREVGHERWNRAVLLWERCLRTNKWPAYVESITTIEAPQWAVAQEMGDRANGNW